MKCGNLRTSHIVLNGDEIPIPRSRNSSDVSKRRSSQQIYDDETLRLLTLETDEAVKIAGRRLAFSAHIADTPVSTTFGPQCSKTDRDLDCHVGGTSQSSMSGDISPSMRRV